jgi:hypothetical protein
LKRRPINIGLEAVREWFLEQGFQCGDVALPYRGKINPEGCDWLKISDSTCEWEVTIYLSGDSLMSRFHPHNVTQSVTHWFSLSDPECFPKLEEMVRTQSEIVRVALLDIAKLKGDDELGCYEC